MLHCYGSHFNYRERYPADMAYFKPESNSEASVYNRDQIMNAYDNTMRYTDMFVDSVISSVERLGVPGAVAYVSDHGEDIFDDSRHRFLHSSPNGTFYQLHVPFVVWTSDAFRESYPEKAEALKANSSKKISSTRSLFHTMLDLSGLRSPWYDPESSVSSPQFRETERLFLNDYLEGVSLRQGGFHSEDFDMLRKLDGEQADI